ncbi:MAG: hypothetical protein MJ188_07860 [Treponema sp.]|nr:hypothetical protein [Treponema sp.]
MKKTIIAGILLTIFMLAACNNISDNSNDITGGNNTLSSTENFSKTVVFNPDTAKVKLKSVKISHATVDEDVVCVVEPLEKKEIELGDEHSYYFTDAAGKKIADLSRSDNGNYLPVYLELNEPKEGKEYLLLNQYKNANDLESFPRNSGTDNYYETYSLLLYEVVTADALDAYKYDDETYIRTYPSANYWIDSEAYASNKIGTKITYNSDFYNNLEDLSNPWAAWGWSTYDNEFNLWFCHRVVSYILHAKDGDSYEVKEIGQKVEVSFYNPTKNDIALYNSLNQAEVTVNAGSFATESIFINKPYYFMDGSTKVDLKIPNGNNNLVLKLNKPEVGKKYICLNQYKENEIELSNDKIHYGFRLFEIVTEAAQDAVEYSSFYIRNYPVASLWTVDSSYANEIIGKEITYSNEMAVKFPEDRAGIDWGWSTRINDKWYCHILVSIWE